MPLATVLMISTDDQQNCDQTKHASSQVVRVVDSHAGCAFETCRICRDPAKLEKEIHELDDSDMLRNHAQQCIPRLYSKTSRNDSHCLFISKLPLEIICYIFSLVIVSQATNSSRKRPNLPYPKASPEKHGGAPVLLLGVCRIWRKIALGQSELWTKVWINVNREPCQITEEWLNRSSPRPLNLTLYGKMNANRKRLQLTGTESWLDRPSQRPSNLTLTIEYLEKHRSSRQKLFDLLRSHSARWGSINLEKAPPTTLFRLFESPLNLPQSDSFELQLGIYSDGTSSRSCIPALQPVRFVSANPKFPVGKIAFEWKNLTTLELRYYNSESVLDIIRQAPQLKHCTFRGISSQQRLRSSNVNVEDPMKSFLHQTLENLTFDGCGTDFFPSITLPSLKYLKYDLDEWNKAQLDEDLRHLVDFVARSDFNPTEFPDKTFALAYIHRALMLDLNHIGRQRFAAAVTQLSLDVKEGLYKSVYMFLKDSDVTVYPNLEEIQLNVFQKIERGLKVRRVVPSMGPDICAALCDLIMKGNFHADLEINLERETSLNPATTPVDDAVDQIRQCDTSKAGNPSINILGQYRRPLKAITVFMDCDDTHPPGTIIKMTKDTFLRLQEAQKTGPLKLNFEFRTEGNVDLLHHSRCLKNDDGDFVTLKSF